MKRKVKISARYIFFLLVVALYAVLSLVNKDLAYSGIVKTGIMFMKIIPLLGLVLAVMVFTNVYLDAQRVRRHLGKESGWKGWFYAIVFGILVSGPPYILFPMLGDLKKKGMKDSLLAVFLYNRNIKIPFLPAMIYYFGLKFTVLLSCLIVVFSVANGLLIEFFTKEKLKIN